MLSWRRKSSNSGLEVLERRLTRLTTGATADEPTDDNLGPLGLSLLHAPPIPLIDFIFVHGLRGGSRKTWSKTKDPYHFWPKEWLSRDPDFKHARIHSFGYDSDWGSGKDSVLNVHDFGKALLTEIVNSPNIKDSDSAIVFVGHSMGGLVIKKACILARQDPLAKSVADRIHGIVFLATPHRGADSATLLNNVIRASTLQKPFISDLERGSSTVQSINDEFRHHASALDLRSFYETVRTSIGISSFIVVDKESATLGYPNEQTALLNATHRGICKFDSPSDSNFISLRNALMSMAREVIQKALVVFEKHHRDGLREIQTYLGISETPEDDLANLENVQLGGTCEWFTSRKEFLAWQDSSSSAPPYYWLRAPPAAGKSILAAHVIRCLEDMNCPCSFFFFKHDDRSKASLGSCLTSIAYQMALIEPVVLQRLLVMQAEGMRLDRDNPLALWRKIFVNGILETMLSRQHFWVFDALDECSDSISITSLLEKISPELAPRIFMTSRSNFETFKKFEALKDLAYRHEMTVVETCHDIDLYVRSHTKDALFENSSLRQQITDTIIAKSCGSFLWAVLVLEEIQSAFSEADIWRVLDDVPQGMNALYSRSLKLLSEVSRGKHVIKAILVWVVYAVRPLSIGELEHALKLDIGENILSLREVLLTKCGNLVQVDKNNRVSVVHETARAFLLQEYLESEITVDKAAGQNRIADVCLAYLNSEEFRPPRSQKLMRLYRAKAAKRSPFAGYACLYFSHHLRRSQSDDVQRFSTLSTFLEGNVCCWIEFVAQASAISVLTQAAKDIKGFLQARKKYYPPVGKEVQRVENWHQDLIRLATQFGQNLIDSPSSIFWLIPPLCPPGTAIGAQFGKSNHGMTVSGLSSALWSDRTASIHYNDRQTRQLACADAYFAVALSDKSMKLYCRSTCQQVLQQNLGQSAKLMTFSGTERLLAICSVHFVMVYRVDGAQMLWKNRLPQECIALSFDENEATIWLTTKGGIVFSFSVAGGSRLSSAILEAPSDAKTDPVFRRVFTCASISLDLSMIAAAQRGLPIGLYDMESGAFIGTCERETDREVEQAIYALSHIQDLVFSASSSASLLGALYHDGDLVSFDPSELAVVARVQANAQTISCSPNGRFLVTGDANGTIQVFEFDSLRLVYRVIGSDFPIKKIAFSSDGLRFYDIRGSQCNIWDPPFLALNDICETASVSDIVAPDAIAISFNDDNGAHITAIACHPSGDFVFCGKDSGSVALYSTATGKEVKTLYQHARGTRIGFVEYAGNLSTLVSADAASRFIVSKVLPKGETLMIEARVLDTRIADYSINQILLSPEGNRLLVSTIALDNVYDLESGTHSTIQPEVRASWKWINHPSGPDKLIHMTTKEAHVHTWDELLRPQAPGAVERKSSTKLISDMTSDTFLKGIAVCVDGCKLAIEFSTSHGRQSTSRVFLLPAAALQEPVPETVESLSQFAKIAPRIEHIVGSLGRRLIFLDRKMWICSFDLEDFKDEYSRHCFIPNEWLSASWDVKMKISGQGDLIFVKVAELAVIKRGLDMKETVKV